MATERVEAVGPEEAYGLSVYLPVLRRCWLKVALVAVAVGGAMFLYLWTKPNLYRSSAVITPALEEKRQTAGLGALASIGMIVGGPSNVEDLETLFKSNDLSVRVFKNHDVWSIVYSGRIDPATGKDRESGGLCGLFGGGGRWPRADWDAIRVAKRSLKVSVNKKAGILEVSFESPSAEGSARVVRHYLDEGKARLQEEALDRSTRNKKFIEEQTRKTLDPLLRDRLYVLYGQEIEREMMAQNREQFGFRVVDTPRVPDRKSGPERLRVSFVAAACSAAVAFIYFVITSKGVLPPSSPEDE